MAGFVARCSPRAERSVPKYLNSPRTQLFTRGQLLFGLSEQGNRLRGGANPVIVEGHLDVLAIASLDHEFVGVSACGTSLRPPQVVALRKACAGDIVIAAYDGHEAGRRAARIATRACRRCSVRF